MAAPAKYADEFDFDAGVGFVFSEQYVDAIHAAENAGYAVIVIDRLTHAWSGKDGALEQVDKVKDRSFDKNSFYRVAPSPHAMRWWTRCSSRPATSSPPAGSDRVRDGRTKTGKTRFVVGLAPINADGPGYEFDDRGHRH